MKTLTATEVAERHNASLANKTPREGHNSGGQLKSYVERFTHLAEQAAELREDSKELAKEAKGNGFDAGAIKRIVKRQMEDESQRAKRETLETVVDTYMNALGMLN
jgi:uncharacterized protein (UPF0335 family)